MSRSEAGKLGAIASKAGTARLKQKRRNEYNKCPNRCKHCSIILPYEKKRNKFCSHSCAASFNNLGTSRNPIGKNGKGSTRKIPQIKKGPIPLSELKSTSSIRSRLLLSRKFCETCGISEWCNKGISLEMHHKDGNNSNNNIGNLIILCPNCHSQTPNYRNRSRN